MSLLNQLQPPAYEKRASQHKSQGLGFKNGYSQFTNDKAGIGGEETLASKINKDKEAKTIALGGLLYDPALTYGNRVNSQPSSSPTPPSPQTAPILRFHAFYKEAIEESQVEEYRVRQVVIHYHIEDGTMMVTEPRVENSGIPQGKIIKRHHIPKPDTAAMYSLPDLYIGADVNFYGRIFRVVNCDQFTATKMKEMGFDVGKPEAMPDDPYTSRRLALTGYKPAPKFDSTKLALRKFLANDRKVLRFYGVWDDREAMYGELHKMVLRYFLVDDTVEVKEIVGPNSGIDPFHLKRTRLPKQYAELADMQVSEQFTDEDLQIGAVINVFGRLIELHDCDEYTRKYYLSMGRNMTPITEHVFDSSPNANDDENGATGSSFASSSAQQQSQQQRPIFGSEHDEWSMNKGLMPKAPRRDMQKLITNDGKILRYAAKLVTDAPDDIDRRFVFSFFLADDTMSIFESQVRNMGMRGGKFIERQKVRLENNKAQFAKASDFFVGAQLCVFKRVFQLIEADEYALRYMETNAPLFPHSNLAIVEPLVKSAIGKDVDGFIEACSKVDKTNTGLLGMDEFKTVLDSISGIEGAGIVKQDIITFFRGCANANGLVPISMFLAAQ